MINILARVDIVFNVHTHKPEFYINLFFLYVSFAVHWRNFSSNTHHQHGMVCGRRGRYSMWWESLQVRFMKLIIIPFLFFVDGWWCVCVRVFVMEVSTTFNINSIEIWISTVKPDDVEENFQINPKISADAVK